MNPTDFLKRGKVHIWKADFAVIKSKRTYENAFANIVDKKESGDIGHGSQGCPLDDDVCSRKRFTGILIENRAGKRPGHTSIAHVDDKCQAVEEKSSCQNCEQSMFHQVCSFESIGVTISRFVSKIRQEGFGFKRKIGLSPVSDGDFKLESRHEPVHARRIENGTLETSHFH